MHVNFSTFFSKNIECLVQTTILYAWYDEVNCNTTQHKFSWSVCSQQSLDGGLLHRPEDLDGAPVCLCPPPADPTSPLFSPPLSPDPLPSYISPVLSSIGICHMPASRNCIDQDIELWYIIILSTLMSMRCSHLLSVHTALLFWPVPCLINMLQRAAFPPFGLGYRLQQYAIMYCKQECESANIRALSMVRVNVHV